MPHARPIKRLKVVAVLWWALAALPLLVAVSVKWFSLSVAAAAVIRAALGALAWRKAQALRSDSNAKLGATRLIFVLAPVVLVVGGILLERMDVPVHQPSAFLPELVLPRRGNMDGSPWFGDRDNTAMAMLGGLVSALLLGITIAAARKPR